MDYNDYMSHDPSSRAIYRLCLQKHPVELYSNRLSNDSYTTTGQVWELARTGDIVLGITSHHPHTINVRVIAGGFHVHSLTLAPDEPQLILGSSFMPLINMRYHTFRLGIPDNASAEDINVIWASCNTEERRTLVTTDELRLPINDNKNDKKIAVMDTVFCNVKRGSATVPPMTTQQMWKIMVRKKQRWLQKIEEELIQKTWSPHRLHWCLDIEDQVLVEF
jgi:hypothetical protein